VLGGPRWRSTSLARGAGGAVDASGRAGGRAPAHARQSALTRDLAGRHGGHQPSPGGGARGGQVGAAGRPFAQRARALVARRAALALGGDSGERRQGHREPDIAHHRRGGGSGARRAARATHRRAFRSELRGRGRRWTAGRAWWRHAQDVQHAECVQRELSLGRLRVYTSSDPMGVQVAGRAQERDRESRWVRATASVSGKMRGLLDHARPFGDRAAGVAKGGAPVLPPGSPASGTWS
jgi:hypothetical protein